MIIRRGILLLLIWTCLATPALAAPRHDICADLGPTVPFGVSSYGAAGDWLEVAHAAHGVDWGFVYLYLTPPDPADLDGYTWFMNHKAGVAQSADAVLVFTFYQLLHIGQDAGLSGSEAEIVQSVLGNAGHMRTYFDNFVFVLTNVASMEPPVLVHVEPDSWGFMMWAMGVEGNDDPTSVFVQVAGSGHPDLAGFDDHAAGLGQALVALRDQYAPGVRLGWHASNFRVGTRPEVVSSFFSQMGDWDVLVGEHPHMEGDESQWWLPYDANAVDTNLNWMSAVTQAANVPILLWQLPVGTTDWHLLGDPGDLSLLTRYAEAGVAGLLLEHQGSGDADTFRASGQLGTVPPASSTAGGTAADYRDRLVTYSGNPVPWPQGNPCYNSDAGVWVPPDAGPGSDATAGTDAGGGGNDDPSGCGCHSGSSTPPQGLLLLITALLGLLLRWQRAWRG